MKKLVGFILLLAYGVANGQVDTSYVYNTTTPYGTLDIRLAKSATRYYFLQENVTFSMRESSPGVKTNTYLDRTSWDSSPYSQGNMKERNGTKDAFILNYRLLFPQGYNAAYAAGYPMIVMMHGAGERGNCWDNNCYWDDRGWNPTSNNPAAPTSASHSLLNNDHNLTHGGSPHLSARNLAGTKLPDDPTLNPRAFPGFVLFPQNLNGWDKNSTSDAIRLIRLLAKKYNINPDRIYVHGLSNGGSGTYEVLKRAPWLFAAALPMSASTDGSLIKNGLAPKVAHVPIWTFQGGQDTAPTPSKTEGFVKSLRAAGADVRYSLYPNLGHGTWNTAYNEPEFFSWILSKSKNKLHVFFNNPAICATTGEGVKLGLAAGFLAYQWQKDGVTIEGATSSEYVATTPGSYRARFSRKSTNPSEAQWNAWTPAVAVTVSAPPQAVINALTSTALRGPDNAAQNTVHLKANDQADRYYWYKNGTLINIPKTSLDDTTRNYVITTTSATSGNGVYTLLTRTASNCPSPLSEPLNLYFGNSAPLLPDSNIPGAFQGSAIDGGQVSLSWTDNSTIETGFEIWRKKVGATSFVFAGRAAANQTSFLDKGLEPSSQYLYKLRVVNNGGRSKYAPSDNVNTNLVINTLGDNVAPSTPQDVQVTSNTINSISLSWTASTDDIGVRRYRVTYGASTVSTVSTQTSIVLSGLPGNTAYNITVAAEDLGGNFSGESTSIQGSTYVTGLTYGHSTGAWEDLDAITTWATPEFTGSVPNFTLSPRTQEDFFNFEFKGYLYIGVAGFYEFRTTSDDGSRLALDNVVLVDNDGLHGDVTVTSTPKNLVAGAHPINVKYFEYTGGNTLTVQYKGPETSNNWVVIPNPALRSAAIPPTPGSPGAPVLSGRMAAELASTAAPEFMLHVFPNPASTDNLSIRVESGIDAPVKVQLIDMIGRPHYENVFTREEASQGAKIQPSQTLLNGIYVLIVNQGKMLTKQKIVIKN